MPFAVTPDGERQLAEQQYLEAQAALLKRNGGDRPAGGTPVHAMADGAADFHDGERRERAARATDASDHADVGDDGEDETAEKTARHPQTGQFSAESEHSPFGLQRPYVQPGHAAESPSNAAGPRVAPVPNVGERTGYQPMVEAISNHGVRARRSRTARWATRRPALPPSSPRRARRAPSGVPSPTTRAG